MSSVKKTYNKWLSNPFDFKVTCTIMYKPVDSIYVKRNITAGKHVIIFNPPLLIFQPLSVHIKLIIPTSALKFLFKSIISVFEILIKNRFQINLR